MSQEHWDWAVLEKESIDNLDIEISLRISDCPEDARVIIAAEMIDDKILYASLSEN